MLQEEEKYEPLTKKETTALRHAMHHDWNFQLVNWNKALENMTQSKEIQILGENYNSKVSFDEFIEKLDLLENAKLQIALKFCYVFLQTWLIPKYFDKELVTNYKAANNLRSHDKTLIDIFTREIKYRFPHDASKILDPETYKGNLSHVQEKIKDAEDFVKRASFKVAQDKSKGINTEEREKYIKVKKQQIKRGKQLMDKYYNLPLESELVSKQYEIPHNVARTILEKPVAQRRFAMHGPKRDIDSIKKSAMIQEMLGTKKIPKIYKRRESVPQPERIPVDLGFDETLEDLESHEAFPKSFERRTSLDDSKLKWNSLGAYTSR
jgi:hypothetical protein